MTREEAIAYGKECLSWNQFSKGMKMYQFIETAIKALSQEPTDDKCHYCEHNFTPYKGNTGEFTEQEPCDDAVSRGVFEQVMWERDIAIGQLKELGYDFGQKIEPCDDAISREDALNSLIENTDFEGWELSQALEAIEKLPSVNPQKLETVTEFADRCRECGKRYVKKQTGHWIWNVENGYCKCSECGIGMGHTEYDYCPNCGARMESEDKE